MRQLFSCFLCLSFGLHQTLRAASPASLPARPAAIAASTRSLMVYVLDAAGVVWSIDGGTADSVPIKVFDSHGRYSGTLSFLDDSARDKPGHKLEDRLLVGCGGVCILNCATRSQEKEMPIPPALGGPGVGFAYQPGADRLFISEPAAGALWTMSLGNENPKADKWLSTRVYSKFGAVGFDPKANDVFVSDPARGAVYFADAEPNTKPKSFETLADDERNIGVLSDPSAVVIDPHGEYLYVADAERHALFRIALKPAAKSTPNWGKFRYRGQFKGEFTGSAALAMDQQGRLWVADKGSGAILLIDPQVPASKRLVERIVRFGSHTDLVVHHNE
jgi:DNA-binding beta-propeller fold protein YncE